MSIEKTEGSLLTNQYRCIELLYKPWYSSETVSKLQSLQISSLFGVTDVFIAESCWDISLIDTLIPAEKALIDPTWSEKRRQQFILGRTAARKALCHTNASDLPVLIASESHAPVWPHGIVGSITHTHSIGISCVSPSQDIKALGIDIETISDRALGVIERIATPEEQKLITDLSDPKTAALCLFTIKEALYKALWPIVKRYIGFQEVSIIPRTEVLVDIWDMMLSEKLKSETTSIAFRAYVRQYRDTLVALVVGT